MTSINTLISDPTKNGSYWNVVLAGFTNPRYLAPVGSVLAAEQLGFDITDCKGILAAFDSNTAAPTIVAEQTNDPTGAAGWFAVAGKRADGSATAMSTNPSTLAMGWIFPRLGVRMRFRVTALTTADLRGRVLKMGDTLDLTNPIQPVSAPSSLGVGGSVAEDGVKYANPLGIGGDARDAIKAAMSAEGDIAYNWLTRNGRQLYVPWAPAGLSWYYAAAAGGIVSSTADVVLKAAAGAGIRNVLEVLTLNHDALGAATEFVIKDGATIIFRGKLQTPAIEGGIAYNFSRPLRGTANTALNFALLTSVTGGVFVDAQGHTMND